MRALLILARSVTVLTALSVVVPVHAQTTETFESELSGSTSFTDNGQVFNITSQLSGPFDIQTGYQGTGWDGTSPDDRYIDNDLYASGGVGTNFSISSADGKAFMVKEMYLYLADNSADVNVSGTLTIVGSLAGGVQFSTSASSGFNTNIAVNNGFTRIDLSSFGGQNNAYISINQLTITTTSNFNYVALDAFKWSPSPIAPTATNLSAGETYTEDTSLNLTDIVVTDPDSSVIATLTLSNPAAGSLSTATSGSVTSTYNASTGVWTAYGAVSSVNALLAGVTFTPAQHFNSNFTIATSVSDGVTTVTGSKAMTGIAVNDAPSATNLSAAETYTEDTARNLTDIVVTDVDAASVTVTLTLSNISAGSLSTATSGAVTSTYNASTGVWTAAGAVANVNTLLAGVTFMPASHFTGNFSIATSVTDGIASALTGSKAMTGIPVNDAPTATHLSAAETYSEDTTLDLTNIVVTDPDSSVTVTLTLSNPSAGSLSTATSGGVNSTYNAATGVWTALGGVTDVNAVLAGVTFTPALHFNGSFTIDTSVSDGVAPAVTGSKVMTGVAVNDWPSASNLSAGEMYVEDTVLELVDIVVTDPDGTPVAVTLTLSDSAAGSLSTATTGAVTSTYDAQTGVWAVSGAVAEVNALLAAVTFTPAANFNAALTLTTYVSDGVAPPLTGIKSITGIAVTDCNPDPCQNGGTCSDVATGFSCQCPAGYSGATCATNIDDCSSNPCQNGGTCTDAVDSFSCTCAPGYSGSTCTVDVDDCASNPCNNGGSCADGVNTYTCTCAAGYMGVRCDVDVNDCDPAPCLNGGTCSDGINAFTCTCPSGFEGATCSNDIDDCASNPCQNGSTCSDTVNGFSCTCAAGYKGATCAENIDDCSPNPCLNGGVCTDGVNGFTCACPPGYSGTICGSNIDECATNPCLNGGSCTDDVNGFICTCSEEFTGTTCAEPYDTSLPADDLSLDDAPSIDDDHVHTAATRGGCAAAIDHDQPFAIASLVILYLVMFRRSRRAI